MKKRLLEILACDECDGNFYLNIFEKYGSEIMNGVLTCEKCLKEWFIINGIPRFLNVGLIEETEYFQLFFKKYHRQFKWIKKQVKNEEEKKEIKTKEKNMNKFGYEWIHFKDWGWIPDDHVSEENRRYQYRGGLISNTVTSFSKKTLIDPQDIKKGNLILDAGCGNGRYTNQAALLGSEVVGVDLGNGVDSAYQNLKNQNNVHIVQADLLHLPFKKEIFDFVFSIGVLMHTGNAEKAFYSISKHIKRGGRLSVHLYHKRNPIFELINGSIRFFTTKMGIGGNIKFAIIMSNIGKKLVKNGWWRSIFKYVEILPTVHHMFDWYSAPVATHHTYPEVSEWYQRMGFEIIKTNKPDFISFFNKPESLTLKGEKK